jgi:hypothetical protein
MTAVAQTPRERRQPSRRDFIKLSAAGAAGMMLIPASKLRALDDFPSADRLGRVLEPGVEIKIRPSADSQTVSTLSQDDVVVWLRDIVSAHPSRTNNVWVETPEGYIHSSLLQPAKDLKNDPVNQLPETSIGPGMWAEVTVPWVEFILDNPPARSPWLQNTETPRLYYSQVIWVDQIKEEEGLVWYRLNERYGFGDRMWAPASAFRRITPEEMSPINPERDDKRVVVRLWDQSMSCFEGSTEVFWRWLGPSWDRLDDSLRRKWSRRALDLLAQRLRSPPLARLCQCQTRRR